MKISFESITLGILCLACVIGWSIGEILSRTNAPAPPFPLELPPSGVQTAVQTLNIWHHYPLSDTNAWLPIFEIWKCQDGTFEVKTQNGLLAKLLTLEEAEEFRYQSAVWDAALFGNPSDRGQDCGVRVK